MMIRPDAPRYVVMFSPNGRGNHEVWTWLCDASNGRQRAPPLLSAEQQKYAKDAGYLPEETA